MYAAVAARTVASDAEAAIFSADLSVLRAARTTATDAEAAIFSADLSASHAARTASYGLGCRIIFTARLSAELSASKAARTAASDADTAIDGAEREHEARRRVEAGRPSTSLTVRVIPHRSVVYTVTVA